MANPATAATAARVNELFAPSRGGAGGSDDGAGQRRFGRSSTAPAATRHHEPRLLHGARATTPPWAAGAAAARRPPLPAPPPPPALMAPRREASAVAAVHGHLIDADLQTLMTTTGYSRRQLYELHARFKALVAVSATPLGVDAVAFRRGQLSLSIEDEPFTARVFQLLDANGSGAIEFAEFLASSYLLEKGSREARAEFLFKIIDSDGSGTIERREMYDAVVASLRMRAPPDAKAAGVLRAFSDHVFSTASGDGGGAASEHICREDVYRFLAQRPNADVPSVFGRCMLVGAQADMHSLLLARAGGQRSRLEGARPLTAGLASALPGRRARAASAPSQSQSARAAAESPRPPLTAEAIGGIISARAGASGERRARPANGPS